MQILNLLLKSLRATTLVMCAVTAALVLSQNATGAPPNVVLILVDDLGKYDLGCEGSEFYETPHIDALANVSVRFTNAYSACQVCSPSRAAIQTGKSPARLGITNWIHPGRGNQPENWKRNTRMLPAEYVDALATDEITIAEALKSLDYQTFFAGKWHLGGEGHLPSDQGYEVNVGGFEVGSPPGGFFSPFNNPLLPDREPGESLPLRLASETADYITQQAAAGKPWFAMLSFYSVHAPIQTTEALWKKYQTKAHAMGLLENPAQFIFDRTQEVRQTQDNPLYAGMMESMDTAVGKVIEALHASKQFDNTIVIFTSDNGGVSSGDGYATACLPLRGGKGRQWEGGIRQPLYIHIPGQTSQLVTDQLATGEDLFPTILELCQSETAHEDADATTTNPPLDGISLVPALHGKALPARKLFWHYPHYGNQGGEPSSIVRDGNWKLIYYHEDGHYELYNLAEDLSESRDVAAENAEITSNLTDALQQWLISVDARMPSINPTFDAAAYEESIQQAESKRMNNRSTQHAAFLRDDFVPQGGWWEQRGHASPK